jgi:hypothetical protein
MDINIKTYTSFVSDLLLITYDSKLNICDSCNKSSKNHWFGPMLVGLKILGGSSLGYR